MAKELNELKELHHLKKRNEEEEKRYKALMDAYKDNILANPKILEEAKPQETYQVGKKTPNAQMMLDDYKKKTGKDASVDSEGTMRFEFDSPEDAVAFFQDQAKKGQGFDAYNAAIDHRIYSDGKGTFVQGTKADVDAYLKNPKEFNCGEKGELSRKEPESTKTLSA
ncbi:hypothetical protein [Legionella cardiaca]|uniref:Substrate of the Dot/Icm secretion system n=1 Tax=Legionella cardiaca TaxID=1071983 RepID=A0ABY8ANB7_9GAMM|nr:hypothetical protein [Legionella cardiaca]WED42155.1 hypothetical protein PXX05_09460 [Legionella cardiaca]